MASLASARIDEVVRSGLAKTLKAEGYRKSARTFRRALDEVTLVVNVQASQWNFGETGRFTLNLGVYAPEIERLVGKSPIADPKEYECMVRSRIGRLTQEDVDLWWDIDEQTDLSQLAAEVVDVYSKCGKPWLDELQNVQGIRDRLVADGVMSLEVAAATLLCGDRDQARTLLSRAIVASRPGATAYRAAARACLERWGLQ